MIITQITLNGTQVGATFYDRLKNDETYKRRVKKTDQEFIKEIQKYMAHEFRYYQKEALATFDFFLNIDRQHYAFKDELYEREFGDDTIPFYGFEMATGSGKTLLIGAFILYLYNKGYKNFLIIVPGDEIYDKTIKNFDIMDKKCVFSNYMDIKLNLVTGDNFVDKTSNYQEDVDLNLFVFNIQKFFDRETGTLRVDKEWEESFWRDKLGNTISFRDYLKNQKLVIITDEAHHYQKLPVGRGKKTSGEIILSLAPEMVLEFTATAITADDLRRSQKIIYNYPIDSFISDGYGKLVRAYGYTGSPYKGETTEVTEDDKKKFLVAFMIHLVKKKALEKEKFKPILLIRARNIEHADNLLYVIQEELPRETKLIESTYKEIIGGEKFEITELIRGYVSLGEFKKEIAALPKKSFVYHSDNESEEDVRNKVDTIETNDQEVLIQIKKLEEGWDIQNPYTILILSLSYGSMKVYVKQMIGRGVRLFRENRRYDYLTNFLDKQQEILHVVCDKGGNFEKFVSEVRDELGLSRGSLEIECIEEETKNPAISEFQKYNELKLPLVKFSSVYKKKPSQLVDDLSFEKLNLEMWIDKSTKSEEGQKLWNWDEEELGVEKAVSEGIDLKRGEADYEVEPLKLERSEIDRLVAKVVASQTLLPSHTSVKVKLKEAIGKINERRINYKKRNESSKDFYVNKLTSSLFEHMQGAINRYFELEEKFKTDTLKSLFPDDTVVIKKEPGTNKVINVKRARDVSVERYDLRTMLVSDFEKSYYEYNWFESSHEFKLAYQIDGFSDVEFWIRNKRTYFLEYGVGNRYHPDFVVKYGDDLFIIEVKGKDFLGNPRTKKEVEIFSKLRSKGYKVLFLLDVTIDDKIFGRAQNFEDVIKNDDLEKVLKNALNV